MNNPNLAPAARTGIDALAHAVASETPEPVGQSQFREAAAAWRALIEADPSNLQASYALAVCLERIGEYGEATLFFESLLEAGPACTEARLGAALCRAKLGDMDRARCHWEKAKAQGADSVACLLGMTYALFRLGRLTESAAACDELLAISPGQAEAMSSRLAIAVAQRDCKTAQEICQTLLRRQPNASIATEGLAFCAMETGDFDAAVVYYSRLARAFPNEPDRWFNLGVASYKSGDTRGGLEAWRETARLHPGHAGAWVNIGVVAWEKEDLQAAKKAWECATPPGQICPEAQFNLALLAEREGDTAGAGQRFALAAGVPSGAPPEAWFRIGCLRLSSGDARGSVQALMEALRLRPEWMEALLNAGIANWRAGDRDAAVASFRQALRYGHDSRIALQSLAALSIEREEYEMALEYQARLAQLGERSAEFFYNTGLLLHRTGQLDDAEQLYKQALQERPGFPDALLNLGHVLAARGDREHARECWAEAVLLMPDCE